MPKINQAGPSAYGTEGVVENAHGEQYQLDPEATPEQLAAGEDWRGEPRPKDAEGKFESSEQDESEQDEPAESDDKPAKVTRTRRGR